MNKKPLKLVLTAYLPDQLKKVPLPKVLFLGRSNVGKSSLINSISLGALAKVSKNPGKTRSINYYSYGEDVVFVDVPGYGYAKRSHGEIDAWGLLMEAFFDALNEESLIYILMDAKRNLEFEELQLLATLQEQGHHLKALLTKADRFNQSERHHRRKELEQFFAQINFPHALTWHFTSVKTGEGLEQLQKQIDQYAKKELI